MDERFHPFQGSEEPWRRDDCAENLWEAWAGLRKSFLAEPQSTAEKEAATESALTPILEVVGEAEVV
jgi:hypothetical protein